MSLMKIGINAIERRWVSDRLTRMAIRRLCRQRLVEQAGNPDISDRLIREMRSGPIALGTKTANEQHYEVPTDFFARVLGPRMKYSCLYFANDDTRLADAEDESLRQTCERAELANGQQILELGCGWGSLSIWMARNYPDSAITSVSNSQSQREYIESVCRSLRIENLRVVTADINSFSIDQKFDRVVSVEMFEHMRNYEQLLARIASWLNDEGKLFVHVFCHKQFSYPFETDGAANWMGRHFFTGGLMPSATIFDHFPNDMQVEASFRWKGTHYQKTLNTWLANMDARRLEITEILKDCYGEDEGVRWFNRWRIFFMASAELFGYDDGNEWFVSHFRLNKVNENK